MKIKKTIAKTLRRWADRLFPTEAVQLPPLSLKVGDLQLLKLGYQYPKNAQYLNFNRIRCRMAQLLAYELLERRTILFTINDGAPYVNTIEASIYVKRPENPDGYEEI